ncbi:MAG: hypothetical protein WBF46_16775, partial [Candidatus Acidiferrales bacterium]
MFRSGVQTATQREALGSLRFSGYVSAVDANGRRAKKPKIVSHPFVANQYFMNLSRDTFCGQDIPEELHCFRVRWASRHIQNFNFHFSLPGFRG